VTRIASSSPDDVATVLDLLAQHRSESVLSNMGPRYGIHAASAIGVSMANMQAVARQVGTSHDLAEDLWSTGIYEARTVAVMIDVPALVTAEQMDRWCGDFDNWAICDTACFNLFDRTTSAWDMVEKWAASTEEFVKRSAFALLWGLALHDKSSGDEPFIRGLVLIEREAHDDRNFVTKAIAMALRATARRNSTLAAAAIEVAERLSLADQPAPRRIGRRALKELLEPPPAAPRRPSAR
jgi:3-methyladenine DNA glycosylase AlkD